MAGSSYRNIRKSLEIMHKRSSFSDEEEFYCPTTFCCYSSNAVFTKYEFSGHLLTDHYTELCTDPENGTELLHVFHERASFTKIIPEYYRWIGAYINNYSGLNFLLFFHETQHQFRAWISLLSGAKEVGNRKFCARLSFNSGDAFDKDGKQLQYENIWSGDVFPAEANLTDIGNNGDVLIIPKPAFEYRFVRPEIFPDFMFFNIRFTLQEVKRNQEWTDYKPQIPVLRDIKPGPDIQDLINLEEEFAHYCSYVMPPVNPLYQNGNRNGQGENHQQAADLPGQEDNAAADEWEDNDDIVRYEVA